MTVSAYMIDYNGAAQGYNRAPGATISATGMSAANIARLANRRQSRVAQASQKSSITIDIDLGSALDVDCIAMLGHNLTSAATVSFQADDDSAYGSIGVDQSITYNENQMIYIWSSAETYRYWRITITDAANGSFPWIGELMIGELNVFSHPPAWGLTEGFIASNVVQETEWGNTYRYHKNIRREYSSVNFGQRPDNEVDEFTAFFKGTKGSFYPALLILDKDDPNEGIYGHITDTMGLKYNMVDNTAVSGLDIKEQPRAKVIKTMES